MGVGYCPAHPAVTTPEDNVGTRRVDDSWLEMVLPFSDQTKLRESMMMDNGKTVRYGKLFELLDALAADVAYRHCGGKDSQLTIVTASVDGVRNFANINIVDDVKMQGYITYTGSSSMEVSKSIWFMWRRSTSMYACFFHVMGLEHELRRIIAPYSFITSVLL
jgi:acyl-CoA hydrolase